MENVVQMGEMRTPTTTPERVHEEERSAEFVAGGSLTEAIAGLGAVVLAIVALAGLFPAYLGPIAAIVLGVALLFEGGSIAARYSRLLGEVVASHRVASELGGGMSAELLGGAGGIVLGILALLGLAPDVLMSVVAIVFGGALLLGSSATWSLNHLIVEHWYAGHETARRVARSMVSAAAGAQVLVGIGAVVLGIVALVGMHPMMLSLIAILAVGASVALSGSAVSGKMFSMLHHA
jgi:hypothetical protein